MFLLPYFYFYFDWVYITFFDYFTKFRDEGEFLLTFSASQDVLNGFCPKISRLVLECGIYGYDIVL